jgi:hypothetical protein
VYSGLPLPTGRYLRESCDDALQLLHAAQSVEISSILTDAQSVATSTEPTEELLSPSKRRRTSPRPSTTDLEHYDKMRTRFQTCSENRHVLAQISAEINSYVRPKRSSPAAQSRDSGFNANATRFSPRRSNTQDGKTFSRQFPRRDHRPNNASRRCLLPDGSEEHERN